MTRALFFVVVLICFAPFAQAKGRYDRTGEDLLEMCSAPADTDADNLCVMYLTGVVLAVSHPPTKDDEICMPKDAEMPQIRSKVVKWLRENAEWRTRRLFPLTHDIFAKLYPCRRSP